MKPLSITFAALATVAALSTVAAPAFAEPMHKHHHHARLAKHWHAQPVTRYSQAEAPDTALDQGRIYTGRSASFPSSRYVENYCPANLTDSEHSTPDGFWYDTRGVRRNCF